MFLIITGLAFLTLTGVFLFFPRTKYSELEKRDLAQFPPMENLRKDPARFTADVSHWFSDSEPFRDSFMTLSMWIRSAMKMNLRPKDEAVSFKPIIEETKPEASSENKESRPVDQNAKLSNAGVIIVGSGKDVRALMAFGGSAKSGGKYVDAINAYADAFPGINIYAFVAPLATDFYLPEHARNASNPQKPTIDYIRNNVSEKVKFIDVYSHLVSHIDEDIYLRTDHHWAPLGAFYGAQALARAAGVPFRDLSAYEEKRIHNYVGTMYGYSKDISIKNAPEDFVYHIPKNLNFETTFVTFTLNKDYEITAETAPYKSSFFKKHGDGSALAYLTFMGGDLHMVKVKTGTPGNRRLLIIKDSYGNPLPGYLFYSFNEVHVVDFRYFTKNLKQYVKDNGITDIVLAFNVFNVCSSSAMGTVKKLLTQPAGIPKIKSQEEESKGEKNREKQAESSESTSTSIDPQPEENTVEPKSQE